MSATKVLDMAEKQGLLDATVIGDLRKQVAESKFVVTAEAIAKILVDHGHLTAFQARKLVATALGEPEPVAPATATTPKAAPPASKPHESELGLADSSSHDDIVEMQVAAPTAKPPLPKPPPAKAAPPKKTSRSHAETKPLDVAPPRPAPPRTVPSPLVPVSPAAAPSPLTPVPPSSPLVPVSPASPLSPVDPLALDPLHAPAEGLTQAGGPAGSKAKQRTPKPPAKNPWANPTFLLLGGGGFLAMVVAFGLLYMAIFATPVAELFAKAGEEYDAGSLGSAKEKYEQFLKRTDAKSDDASLARVRLGMIDLRQASAEGRNPKPGIEAANRILPTILTENRFDDCRLELRTILVSMAQTSAKAAQSAKATDKKEELVAQTEEAFKLVDNASYIPSSIRGDVQQAINTALDVLKAARRSIDQDKDLQKAIAEMNAAIESKDAAKAFQIRGELLRTYPALEADEGLIAATTSVTAMEQSQSRLEGDSLAPLTQEESTKAATVTLSHTSGTDSSLTGQFVATLVQGAVYGFDAGTGKLLWRRFVGHDTTAWPQPVSSEAGADILLVDGQRQELVRVKASDGQLVWRLPIGKQFAPPIVGSDLAYLTTADGRIVEVDLTTGQSDRQMRLPQSPTVPIAYDTRGRKLFQLGRSSTLFVFDGERMSCTETYYLGHKAGAILVPPVVVLDHLLIAESPGDDFTLIHTLSADAETKKLKRVADPIRLKGRVVVPLVVDRQRAVAVTDAGQVVVIQVDPANKERPVRQMASGGAAASSTSAMTYFAVSSGQVFLTNERVAALEIQSATQDIKSKWQLYSGDAFVAPPQVLGKVLVHVRRPKSSLATTVEACQTDSGKMLWRTEIAAPVAAITYHSGRNEVAAINNRGRVYELPVAALAGGYFDKGAYNPLPGTESMSLTDAVELGSGKLALLGPQAGPHALTYDPNAAANRAQQSKFSMDISEATAAATFFQGGLALPQHSGQVLLLDPESAGHKAQPFQPALEAGQRITWNRPTPVPPDGTSLAVADGQRTIYRLTIRPQPQPHLELAGETVLESDVVSPLAGTGDTVLAVVRGPAADQVVALQGDGLTNIGKSPLTGRVRFGPVAAAGLIFIADEKDLHAFEAGGKVRWSQPLAHGLPAMPPLTAGGEWILVSRDGTVSRLAADSGEELATASIGQPAGSAAVLIDTQIVVAGADGTLTLISLP